MVLNQWNLNKIVRSTLAQADLRTVSIYASLEWYA